MQPGVIPSVEWNTTPTSAGENHRARYHARPRAKEAQLEEGHRPATNNPSGRSSQMLCSSVVATPEIEMFELVTARDYARTVEEAQRLEPHRDVRTARASESELIFLLSV